MTLAMLWMGAYVGAGRRDYFPRQNAKTQKGPSAKLPLSGAVTSN